MAAYLFTVGLLGAVLVIGRTVNGSKRWLGLGVLGGQPSELMKLALIVFYARLFSSDPLDLRTRPVYYAVAWHLGLLVPVLLILKQPDLGTALLCAVVAASLLLLVPLSARVKAAVLTVDLSVAAAAGSVWPQGLSGRSGSSRSSIPRATHRHRLARAPGHLRHRQWSPAGQGYLRGTQNQLQFLPEHWTDFPFAVWAEGGASPAACCSSPAIWC